MTVTPVGMRCPECAREKTKVRRISPGLQAGRAPATYALIAINVAAFLAEVAGGSGALDAGGRVFREGGLYGPDVADGEWWRIVTSGFLHAGILHIAFNMYVLFVLGTLLEPGIGTPRFLGVYFVSLLAGAFGALLLSPNALTVGASGAIFGLMSAAFIVARHRGVEQIAGQLAFFIVINLFFTLGVSGISVGGHLGGLVGGALAGLLVVFAERSARRPVAIELLGMIALGVVSIAGCLAAAATG
jgi:membrane associated rhomboid family serine protease